MTALSEPRVLGRITVLSRAEFLNRFAADYHSGQHVTFLGPTGRGKTFTSQAMLKVVIKPELPVVILAGKPPLRDKTMAKAADNLNLRIVTEWPPIWHPGDRKRNGYVLRPNHTMKDLDADNENLRNQFRKCLMGCYASKTPVIVCVDEAYQVQNDLKLKKEYEAILLRGAPVVAEWSLLQRGRFSSYLAYDAPEHIVMFKDPDTSNVKRYAELVGGVNPYFVSQIVAGLETKRAANGNTISEFLYIRRSGPELYVVSPD
jgi:hypothetical protein